MKSKKIKKINVWMKKIVLGAMTMVAAFQMRVNPVLADTNSGLTAAKDNVINQVKPIVNGVIVPILLVLLVAGLVFAIVYAVYSYRKGRDIELGWIVALVIGIVLISTFPTWGWQLIG